MKIGRELKRTEARLASSTQIASLLVSWVLQHWLWPMDTSFNHRERPCVRGCIWRKASFTKHVVDTIYTLLNKVLVDQYTRADAHCMGSWTPIYKRVVKEFSFQPELAHLRKVQFYSHCAKEWDVWKRAISNIKTMKLVNWSPVIDIVNVQGFIFTPTERKAQTFLVTE